jgi:hypothetical protein
MAAKQIGLVREAWGPRFWSILHRLAELSGNQKVDIMVNDEAEAWIVFLKAQALVMPCIMCKDHYQEWLTSHRPERVRFLFGEERRQWLRHWLWGCHDRVNQLTNKISPPEEELPNLYEKRSIQKEIVELGMMFQLALSKGLLKHEDIVRWKHVVARIRTMTGI